MSKTVIYLLLLVAFSQCRDYDYDEEEYDEYGSGEDEEYEERGSGNDYDYNYDYDQEDRGSGDFYDYEASPDDSELAYIPDITSRSLRLAVRPGDQVQLPCDAVDAEKFVRVWMKEGVMLFTGNIRLNQDHRLSLAGPGNSSLVIDSSTPADSGQYECRIMVSQTVSVSHTLIVTQSFSIQANPSEGVVMVPLRGSTAIGCKIIGEPGANSSIVWSRDNNQFRDGAYSVEAGSISLENITMEDSGYYYCTAQGPDGETKTSSIQVQVLFPPSIFSISKRILQSGKGMEAEISCVVRGQPRPRVIWYKEGEVIKLTGRTEAQQAGSRQILLIHNIQESDYGSYMCYATNSMGSVQKIIEIKVEDKDNKELQYGQEEKHEKDLQRNYKILNKNLHKDRRALIKLKFKMEQEIQSIKNELSLKKTYSKGVQMEDSFEKAILADIERLDEQYRSLQVTFHGYETKFQVLERSFQDDSQRIWDNLNELQELTNITTRNIEDIYDKDILRLQNFQNVFEGDLSKMKNKIKGALRNEAVGGLNSEENHNFETEAKIYSIEEDVKKIINRNRNNQNLYQSFRDDLNTAFGDIDELKKEKQANAIEIENLKRYITQLEVEKIEDNMVKIDEMGRLVSNLDSTVARASQKMRKKNKNSGEDEKVGILLKEVQNMKNQMFFLQQSVIQLRTQEHLSLEVGEHEVGPAYNSDGSADLARVKTDLDTLAIKIGTIENLLSEKEWVEKDEFFSRNQYVEERLDVLDEKVDDAIETVNMCDETALTNKYAMIGVTNQLQRVKEKQEETEAERAKYFLLISGLRKRRKLERPFHVMNLASHFIADTLQLMDISLEEAYRLQDQSGKPPFPIRIRFANLADRNSVLSAGRQLKGSVRIAEELTERVKKKRKHLVAFARQAARQNKTRWALQGDKLYFNKKIYVFNETTESVEPISDIV